ncbi:hypothetical protein B9G55_18445 [Saccharibacillus sp. O16]|nr:hypothetical protein B9G55_18445 [Saccharibacillus sp. O16]
MRGIEKIVIGLLVLFICLLLSPLVAFSILGGGMWLDKITFSAEKEAKIGKEYLEEKYKEEFEIDLNSVKYRGYSKDVTFAASPKSDADLHFIVQADSQRKSLYRDNYMLNKAVHFIFDPLGDEDRFYYEAFLDGSSRYSADVFPGIEAEAYIQEIKDYSIQINLFTALDLGGDYESLVKRLAPFVNKVKEIGLIKARIVLLYPRSLDQEQQKVVFENMKKMRMNNEIKERVLGDLSFESEYAYKLCSIEIPDLEKSKSLAAYIKENCSELRDVFSK